MNTLEKLEYRAKHIALLILDVDGVLTDGRITYSSTSEEVKSFHTHDGLGIKLLQMQKVNVAILTGRKSDVVTRRAKELGITVVIQNSQNKLNDLKQLMQSNFPHLTFDNIGYVGDDIQDLLAMQSVGLSFAPQNAHKTILEIADYTTKLSGGFGAVREVCDLLINAKS